LLGGSRARGAVNYIGFTGLSELVKLIALRGNMEVTIRMILFHLRHLEHMSTRQVLGFPA
jgi:hypothetical protein